MDKLTGISSFRGFIDETDKLLADNPNDNFDIFVWDIVQFKVINDLYGMEAGDWLLKEIAAEIKAKVTRGTCGRIGNDKFVCCVLQMISFIVLRIMYMYSAGKAWNTVFLYREAATR